MQKLLLEIHQYNTKENTLIYIFYRADTGKIVGASNHREMTWSEPTECIEVSQLTVPLERARVNLETLEIEPIPE